MRPQRRMVVGSADQIAAPRQRSDVRYLLHRRVVPAFQVAGVTGSDREPVTANPAGGLRVLEAHPAIKTQKPGNLSAPGSVLRTGMELLFLELRNGSTQTERKRTCGPADHVNQIGGGETRRTVSMSH